jgi:tetratricopeptide (TPR) repeat protein
LQPSLPRDLETICLKCLHKEPGQRYATAQELAEDLQRFLSNQPIHARPASMAERAFKYVRRNWLLVGATSAVIVALSFGFISSTVSAARADKAREVADKAREVAEDRLAQVHYGAAHALVQRGKQKEAIEMFQKALDAGHPDRLGIQLEMALAYAAIYKQHETREILDRLLKEPKLGKYEGPAILLKAYTTMGVEVDEAMGMVKKAIAKGLPPADNAFAHALLAETTPEAIDWCKKALKAQAHHHPSHLMLGLLLVLMGRMDEAREAAAASNVLFPDDPNIRILNSILMAVAGKRKEALDNLKVVKEQISPKQYRVVETTVELVHYIQKLDDAPDPIEQTRVLALWARIIPDVSAVWPVAMEGKLQKDPERGASQLLQMPPVLNRSLVEMMKAVGGAVFNFRSPEASRKLGEVVKKHPEGLVYYLHGSYLAIQKRWPEAREALLKAAHLPSIARIKRVALSTALLCDLRMLEETPDPDQKLLNATREHLDEFLLMGKLQSEDILICGLLAVWVGEDYRGLELLQLVEKQKLAEPARYLEPRMVAAWRVGDHCTAVVAAEQLLKLEPTLTLSKKYRDRSLNIIREMVKARAEK